ncbi:helicase-related protein [Pseudomonas sp. NY15364]|uniref:helicase-related protein n=1 Tax=Pseudomonas sp. NY15364 TaxID=3400353 RepID=UPI003A8B6AD4
MPIITAAAAKKPFPSREAVTQLEAFLRTTTASAGGFRTFDAPGNEFKLALEALRVSHAHLFDPMMALHTSAITPLPHQINAVYEVMLQQQPLRFVLADDPGAGKTVMAGLLLKEMLLRGDARRVLIVAPGALTEQWQNELDEKFGIRCETLASGNAESSSSGNHFADHDLLIARLDQLARNQRHQRKLQEVSWDLVIIDEAHKLSAGYRGRTVSKTQRFLLAEILSRTCRHLLLITATPHNGKEEEFRLLLSLLDSDRFGGRHDADSPSSDLSDILHRTVKENLRDIAGNRLLPSRHAYTATYDLSPEEAALYCRVTEYVRAEMSRADRLGGRRREAVGFALTLLQRRLASSSAALYRSLQRRRLRLEQQLEKLPPEGVDAYLWDVAGYSQLPDDLDEAADELPPEEYESLAERIVNEATAASSRIEVESEIRALLSLENQAEKLLNNGTDRKWDELSSLLKDRLQLHDTSGRRHKLIIFTEHRDTLYYLLRRIRSVLGSVAAVAIHGGLSREERRQVQQSFSSAPEVQVLVATDAAGEGVNLQCANVMVNFDLPWNPNRLEQRFGRIHRIGQTEPCHLWNLVARGTLEGRVFETLFAKLEVARSSLGGRIFDVLGQAFENRPLESLLRETIREGNQHATKGRLEQAVAQALDTGRLQGMLERISPANEPDIETLKDKLTAAARNVPSPEFLCSFLGRALTHLGGEMTALDDGYFRIPTVPAAIREHDRLSGERQPPVLRRYERIRFDRQPASGGSAQTAEIANPSHPLVRTCANMLLERLRPCLERGSVLVDTDQAGGIPGVLMVLEHNIHRDLQQPPISRRIQLIRCDRDGSVVELSWGDALELRAAPQSGTHPTDSWQPQEIEELSVRTAEHLAKEHLKDIEDSLTRQAESRTATLRRQMLEEIDLWSRRYLDLRLRPAGNRQPAMQEENARSLAETISQRLQAREEEAAATRHVAAGTPRVLGIAMIASPELLPKDSEHSFCADAVARGRIERMAMQAVIEAERALGHTVHDVSAEKCGWDITAICHCHGHPACIERRIEVKGRAKGQNTITVTRNEISQALDHPEHFILAVALIAPDDRIDGPYYIRNPFEQKPDWAETSRNLDLDLLLQRSVGPLESIRVGPSAIARTPHISEKAQRETGAQPG